LDRAESLSRVRTSCVAWCWNGKETTVSEDERERKEAAVLPARKAMSLLGEEPAESESSGDESKEPSSDVVADPEGRSGSDRAGDDDPA
jgi:hypothetical protein